MTIIYRMNFMSVFVLSTFLFFHAYAIIILINNTMLQLSSESPLKAEKTETQCMYWFIRATGEKML